MLHIASTTVSVQLSYLTPRAAYCWLPLLIVYWLEAYYTLFTYSLSKHFNTLTLFISKADQKPETFSDMKYENKGEDNNFQNI